MIKDIMKSGEFLFFTNENVISYRISNHGKFGWRLQLSANGYDSFSDFGAAQSLSQFMKETLDDAAIPYDTHTDDDELTLKANDGTVAKLSLNTSLLEFYASNGNCITRLANAAYINGKLTLTGLLSENEAIFGGGERFDGINKRGKAFELYTSDGWDSIDTTYVVQPLFLTSNGGGMFFNRYEQSAADFGAAVENEWSYTHRGDLLDCYFYPTGDMNGAIAAFTKLAGHALMPTPWMQGVQICRYAPDFRCFEKDFRYDNFDSVPEKESLYVCKDADNEDYVLLNTVSPDERKSAEILYKYNEDAEIYMPFCVRDTDGTYRTLGPKGSPGGDSCKRIMKSYMSCDAKPDAALMEGRIWRDCFDDTDESRAKKADLQKTVEWLHANGIKAMVYMRIGSTNSNSIGFKEEYLVHADVEVNYPEGTRFYENSTGIPWVVGTGENPDVQRGSSGIRTEAYLDITNPEAVDWYFNTIWRQMIEIGIDGVKIDFCEVLPDNNRNHGITKTQYKWKNPDVFVSGSEHHAYPTFFISAFTKRMNELKKEYGFNDGFMVFSRGGGIGSQRNPYLWEGDQTRRFVKLQDQLTALMNSGLSAIPFISYDMAGYAYYMLMNYFHMTSEEESEIFARAVEFTAFTTNIQTHGDVRHMYEMTPQTQEIYKNFVELHYELLPYMQKYSAVACKNGLPPVRHLSLKYQNDLSVHGIEDEFMLGDALLVAPILSEQTFERKVYLPDGIWKCLLTDEIIQGGKTVSVKAKLGQIPVFLDMSSDDAQELLNLFDGEVWKKVKNG